jgi:hypothetical protein
MGFIIFGQKIRNATSEFGNDSLLVNYLIPPALV